MRRTCIPAPPLESEPAIVNTERSGVFINIRKGKILQIILSDDYHDTLSCDCQTRVWPAVKINLFN
jgi:hypothetical protein